MESWFAPSLFLPSPIICILPQLDVELSVWIVNKNWLGNHHKSKSGRTKLIKRTTLPAVRPTAYSLFCKEYSKDHPGFNPSVWKMEWDSTGEEEKERYAKMARGMAEDGGSALADDPSSQRKTIRTLLKQLEWTSKRLEIMGLPNFALVAENNTVHSVGTGRGREFLDHEETELKFSKFYIYFSK